MAYWKSIILCNNYYVGKLLKTPFSYFTKKKMKKYRAGTKSACLLRVWRVYRRIIRCRRTVAQRRAGTLCIIICLLYQEMYVYKYCTMIRTFHYWAYCCLNTWKQHKRRAFFVDIKINNHFCYNMKNSYINEYINRIFSEFMPNWNICKYGTTKRDKQKYVNILILDFIFVHIAVIFI
jgi:hypothetical protein